MYKTKFANQYGYLVKSQNDRIAEFCLSLSYIMIKVENQNGIKEWKKYKMDEYDEAHILDFCINKGDSVNLVELLLILMYTNKKLVKHYKQVISNIEQFNYNLNDAVSQKIQKKDVELFIKSINNDRRDYLDESLIMYELDNNTLSLINKYYKNIEQNIEVETFINDVLKKPAIKKNKTCCSFENECQRCVGVNTYLYCLNQCEICESFRKFETREIIKNGKESIQKRIILEKIADLSSKNPYVETKDKYYEVFITSKTNDVSKLKRIFIYYMVRHAGKTLFPNEEEEYYSHFSTYPVLAAYYGIKKNVLHGLIRYQLCNKGVINSKKLIKMTNDEDITIKVNNVKNYKDIRHCVDKRHIDEIWRNISCNDPKGSRLEDFYIEYK